MRKRESKSTEVLVELLSELSMLIHWERDAERGRVPPDVDDIRYHRKEALRTLRALKDEIENSWPPDPERAAKIFLRLRGA